LFELL